MTFGSIAGNVGQQGSNTGNVAVGTQHNTGHGKTGNVVVGTQHNNGHACKFHFEDGTIDGWVKTGTVFNNQPTYGDNPTARHRGQPAHQQGDWWIGGAENRPSKHATPGAVQLDGPQGILTSPLFKINGHHISFLIGGGCDMSKVRAELIIDGKVVKKATGKCDETMKRQSWDVGAYIGKSARLKLIDFSSASWGHINFDDLKGDITCLLYLRAL